MKKLLCALFLTCAIFAKPTGNGLIDVLSKDEIVNGDYFARGSTVEISGVVNGDVYILGGQVFIDGQINGNLLVCGGAVQVEGSVVNNVRAACGQVAISGNIGGSVTSLCGTLKILPSAKIGKSVVTLAGNTDLSGDIGGSVYVGTSSLRIADTIRGSVTAYVNTLRITSRANVIGPLEYWSNSDALADKNANLSGGIIHHPSFFYSLSQGKILKGLRFGSTLLPILMNFLYTLGLGLILMRYFPQNIQRALHALKINPVHSFFTGVVMVVLLPLLSLLFLMSILGMPFAITLIAVNVFAFYTAKIFSILWIEKLIFKTRFEKHKKMLFTFGLIVYFTLTSIPKIGPLVAFIAMILGLGAMVRGRLISLGES